MPESPPPTPALLIVEALERLRESIEARLHDYCAARDWQKLREWEMAGLAVEEAAVELAQLAVALRADQGEVTIAADPASHHG